MSKIISFRVFIILMNSIFITILNISVANAQLKVCNHEPEQIDISIIKPVEGKFERHGWYAVNPNKCIVLQSKISSRFYYIYAHTENKIPFVWNTDTFNSCIDKDYNFGKDWDDCNLNDTPVKYYEIDTGEKLFFEINIGQNESGGKKAWSTEAQKELRQLGFWIKRYGTSFEVVYRRGRYNVHLSLDSDLRGYEKYGPNWIIQKEYEAELFEHRNPSMPGLRKRDRLFENQSVYAFIANVGETKRVWIECLPEYYKLYGKNRCTLMIRTLGKGRSITRPDSLKNKYILGKLENRDFEMRNFKLWTFDGSNKRQNKSAEKILNRINKFLSLKKN